MNKRAKILLVDDDDGVRLAVSRYLRARGYDVAEAASCQSAEAVAGTAAVDRTSPVDGPGGEAHGGR